MLENIKQIKQSQSQMQCQKQMKIQSANNNQMLPNVQSQSQFNQFHPSQIKINENKTILNTDLSNNNDNIQKQTQNEMNLQQRQLTQTKHLKRMTVKTYF